MKGVAAGCTSLDELDKYRGKMKQLGDKNAAELKKNVYSNYKYYIDTSKEISNIHKPLMMMMMMMMIMMMIFNKYIVFHFDSFFLLFLCLTK